ncbi:transposase [Pseudonocardia sp.]|uniref:transposase n=1 Tax=Pseudonocardia sp. TaxID=60912 RepID=UPI003452CFDC
MPVVRPRYAKRYPPEFRREVLDLVTAGRRVAQVAADLDISQQCIYAWRRQQMIDLGQIPGTTTAPRTIALLMCRAGIKGLPNHRRPAHVTTPRPPST